MSDPNKPTPPTSSGSGLFSHLYTTHGPGTSTKSNTPSPRPKTVPTTDNTPEKPSKDSSTPQAQTPRPPRTSSGSPPSGSPNLASPTPTATTRPTKTALATGSSGSSSSRSSSSYPRSIIPDTPSRSSLFFGWSPRRDVARPSVIPQPAQPEGEEYALRGGGYVGMLDDDEDKSKEEEGKEKEKEKEGEDKDEKKTDEKVDQKVNENKEK